MPPPRRKKWTEAEERTLIDKYGEMVSDGSLSKMKTREKKYKPIALHVNSLHHLSDPIAYPWEWSWKDVSNKVQNMRHQYSLVKQKIKQPDSGDLVVSGGEGFDWVEGLTHWSNFLRYKEVFGDITLPFDGNNGFDESNQEMEIVEFGNIGIEPNGVMGLEYDYEEENYNDNNENGGNGNGNHDYGGIERIGNKKRKVKNLEKKAWGFVANQLAQLREMEARFEQREEERERDRNRKELLRLKNEEDRRKQTEERRKQRNQEWEAMENERRRRRDEELVREREWEERGIRRRSEWNRRIDEMLSQHRVEMAQIHGRILEEQQNFTSQLLGIVGQWGGTDNGSANNHYLSQMMQNLQHVGGMVDGDDTRVEGHNQDDQFIVDG
ncbi:hypothetical protein L2E82_34972 [Cichorium intybus]|uniref:Uncharacterized protein n=1 Tax=Cichorium intybus TaxID=13427 RepID=A0ACB9BN10_CICIN|nr:hypothetical protein L2E82_34972 [Cichorium intybus]